MRRGGQVTPEVSSSNVGSVRGMASAKDHPQCRRGPEGLLKSWRDPAGTLGARCQKNVCDIICAHEAFDYEGILSIAIQTWERMAIDMGITSEKSAEKATHRKNVA